MKAKPDRMDTEAITVPFNATAATPKQEERALTPLEEYIAWNFGADTMLDIVKKLNQLQIPLPEKAEDFMRGQTGFMFFSNPHGVIIRIEATDGRGYGSPIHVNDSEWMLQPLGALKVNDVVLEILPGIHLETSDAESRKLYWKMWADGYHYWDERIDNAGRLPPTPGFPDGATVILDRLSATKLSNAIAPVKRALQLLKGSANTEAQYRSPLYDPELNLHDVRAEFRQLVEQITGEPSGSMLSSFAGLHTLGRELWPEGRDEPQENKPLKDILKAAIERMTAESIAGKKLIASLEQSPQETLYGGLRRKFLDAWPEGAEAPDAAKMTAFWSEVLEAKKQGRLVAGWAEVDPETAKTQKKTSAVQKASTAYETAAQKIGQPYALTYGVKEKKAETTTVVVEGKAVKNNFIEKLKSFVGW